MTPTNTPSPAVAREEKTPDTPVGIANMMQARPFTEAELSAELRKQADIWHKNFLSSGAKSLGYDKGVLVGALMEAANRVDVLTARIAALEKELEEANAKYQQLETLAFEHASGARAIEQQLTASREGLEAAKALNAKKTKALELWMDGVRTLPCTAGPQAGSPMVIATKYKKMQAALDFTVELLATGDGTGKE